MKPNVIEVSEATFQKEVVERSNKVLVLVDFWAPWCGPCRMLTPILEQLAAAGNGRWVLAKVNSDENPRLSQRFGVQGIPNVKAFKSGRLVDEFVGAQPRPVVERFLAKWLPNQWDESVALAEKNIEKGDLKAARAALEAVVRERPDHEKARLALARVELQEGHGEAALKQLEAIPARGPNGAAARALQAEARFLKTPQHDLEALKQRVEQEPNNPDARFELANAAVQANDYDTAAVQLLHILEKSRDYKEGAAHKALLDLFSLMGEDDPRMANYRRSMGWLLFA
ncbi:MAG TPA: tetratricopeptide repeat protein [Ardenticatenaceae bacterium]